MAISVVARLQRAGKTRSAQPDGPTGAANNLPIIEANHCGTRADPMASPQVLFD